MRKSMVCKQYITWSGRVCWGKLFEIYNHKGKLYAKCNACRHEYDLSEEE